MENGSILRLENVSKFYIAEGKVVPALEKTNLSFPSTGLLALVGESGSGKTTLLNLIAGNLNPDSGFVYYGKVKIAEMSEAEHEDYNKKQIGFIYQNFELIGHYTARENIMSALLLCGEDPTVAIEKTDALVNKVGLNEHADIRVSKLSAGQRQRVGIARVLARDTKIILADEPTANLDPENGKQVMELLRECALDHLIILVTHNIEQAESYATRTIKMRRGRVEEDSEPCTLEPIDLHNRHIRDIDNNKHIPLRPFIKWDMKSSSLQNLLALFFLTMAGLILFFFYGTYTINSDETPAKVFTYSAFQNNDMRRIAVVRADGVKMSSKDTKWAKKMNHVDSIDLYDSTADIRYYLEEGKDYQFNYLAARLIGPLDETNFVRSASAISEEELYAGLMPVNEDEMVLCSDNTELLGREYKVYFKLILDSVEGYYYKKIKVTGLVHGNSHQAYFSNKLCDMMNAYYEGPNCTLNYLWNEQGNNFEKSASSLPQIDKNLTGNTVATSISYIRMFLFATPQGACQFDCKYYGELSTLILERKLIDINVIPKDYTHEEKIEFDVEVPGNLTVEKFFYNENGFPFVDVSEELFYSIYDTGSRQMSIYVEDYAYLDRVLKKINDSGEYIAASTYRLAAKDLSEELNTKRKRLMSMSLFTLFITTGAIVFVVCMIYIIRKRDYLILHKLGMKHGLFRKIILTKFSLVSIMSVFMIGLILSLLYLAGNKLAVDKMKYLMLPQYATCCIWFLISISLGAIMYLAILKRAFRKT